MKIPKFGKIPGILAVFLLAGYFAAFWFVVVYMKGENEKIIAMMIGTLGTMLTSAATYHFTKDGLDPTRRRDEDG